MAKRPGKTYRLVWPEEHELMSGVEIRLKGLSIRQLLNAQRLADNVADQREANGGKVDHEVIESLFDLLAKNITSWNIEEEDGTPVAHDLEGIMSLELDPAVEVLTEWLEAVAGVSPPLSESSSDGEPSEALSLTMEPLSESPVS